MLKFWYLEHKFGFLLKEASEFIWSRKIEVNVYIFSINLSKTLKYHAFQLYLSQLNLNFDINLNLNLNHKLNLNRNFNLNFNHNFNLNLNINQPAVARFFNN